LFVDEPLEDVSLFVGVVVLLAPLSPVVVESEPFSEWWCARPVFS
jgi:hypothetical protein